MGCRLDDQGVDWATAGIHPQLAALATPITETQVTYAQPVVPLNYGGYEAAAAIGGVETGGFWIRVGAYILDYLLLAIPGHLISVYFSDGVAPPVPGTPPSLSMLAPSLATMVFTIGLNWLYFAFMESSPMQAKIAKINCGLMVTDLQGQRISFARASGRYFARMISGLILCIGYIMVGIDAQNRGLHDMLASTLVVRKRSMPSVAVA